MFQWDGVDTSPDYGSAITGTSGVITHEVSSFYVPNFVRFDAGM